MSDHPFTLKGKTIFITGASSGIGRSVAVECSRMGARLIITGRSRQCHLDRERKRAWEVLFLPQFQWSRCIDDTDKSRGRSEEHTSELQSRGHLVCRLLLE